MKSILTYIPIKTNHILLIMCTVFISSVLSNYSLPIHLMLYPQQVTHDFEWWRLITHLVAVNDWSLALTSLMVIMWIGTEIESFTHKSLFSIGLLSSAFVFGLLYSLLSINSQSMGAGFFSILYCSSLCLVLLKNEGVQLGAFKKIKLTIASTLIIGLSIIYLTVGFFSVEVDFVYKASIEIGFGLLSGGFVGMYWNWKNKKYVATLSAHKKNILAHSELKIPVKAKHMISDTYISIQEVSMSSSQHTNATEDTIESMDDTAKLNFILEKIHVESIECLTQEEISFLKNYSES
jgi:hypothetical protein